MKKVISFILVLSILLGLFSGLSFNSAALSSSGSCGKNVTYTFKSSTGLLTISGSGAITNFSSNGSPFYNQTSIKKVVINSGVTSIGEYAFSGCSGLTSITIPNSVTSIGRYAFSCCSGLTSITIPDSVKSIGDRAFISCSGLTSITIPNSVTSIGRYAFSYCSGLTSITVDANNPVYDSRNNCNAIINTKTNTLISGCKNTVIPNSVTSIGYEAFYNCTGLTSITIPDSVTSIGDGAFSYCSGLKSITIPDSVTSIGNSAFSGCSGLTSITIPDSVTSIGYYAFSYCSGLKSITIPDSVTSIGDDAFRDCSKLTSITIPDSVTSIGYEAFYNCRGLTSITIPDSVTSIGSFAFYKCSGLTSITIPDSVTRIGHEAFYNCRSLTKVNITDLSAWCNISFYDEYANPLCFAHNLYLNNVLITDLVIPDSVTSIGDYAFYGCSRLKELTIPCSAKVFNSQNTFHNCTNIEKVTLTKGTGIMQDYADSTGGSNTYYKYTPWYISRNNLEEIVIGEGVTSIGDYAFYYCSGLTNITIGNSVTRVGNDAFHGTSNNLKVTASCQKIFVNDIIECTNRTWNKQHGADSAVEVVPSTCTAKGYTTHTCSVCGDNYKDTYTDALGHNNKSVTTKAKINANGKIVTTCKRCGVSSTKTIYYPKTISLSKNAFVYNKKVHKPTVTVKDSTGKALKNGTDYSVAYTNNKVVGTAKAVITFAGKYSGTKTLTFTILPKGTSLAKLTPAKKAFTAQWTKQAVQTTGYQLQYATNAKFTKATTKTLKGAAKVKLAIKTPKGGTRYYVRVRTYKTIGGKNYYSAWSGAKAVITKK